MDTVQNVVSKYMERDVIYLLSQKLIVAALSAATSKRTFMIWGGYFKEYAVCPRKGRKWKIQDSGY